MKNKKLEVGMSFDVVEVTKSLYGNSTFVRDRTTIMLNSFAIPNSDYYRAQIDDFKPNIFEPHYGCFWLPPSPSIKKIGKLTITKLK